MRSQMGFLHAIKLAGMEMGSYQYSGAPFKSFRSQVRKAPEGMYELNVPAATWAIFPGSGLPSSIQDLMKRIYAEWLPASGYEWANAPDLEVYLDDNPTNMKYEVWLPVVKKT